MSRHMTILSIFLLTCLQFCTASAADSPAASSETTTRQLVVETAGIGSDLQAQVDQAEKTLNGGEPSQALLLIDPLLEKYSTLMQDKKALYISVSSDAQFDDFLRKNPGKTIRRVAWNLQKLLFLKAFILATESPLQALQAIDKLQKIAPYNSDSYCEQGYILCRQKNFPQALESYRQALKLAGLYASEKHNLPAALRGEAFCLVNMGKLTDAQISYRKALEIEPENKIALQGLAYIRRLQEDAQ